MQIIKEHKSLIISIIQENPLYKGNEELLDLIVEAVYKKSYLIIDAIRDKKRLKRHLAVICDNCIEQIVKEKNRFSTISSNASVEFSQNNEVVSVKKTPFMERESIKQEINRTKETENLINLKEEIQRSEKYDAVDMLIDPINYCPKKRVSENTVDKLVQIIKSIEEQYPNKRYFEIFLYRYVRRYNQTDTAREMKISQVELSKRFVELIRLVREQL